MAAPSTFAENAYKCWTAMLPPADWPLRVMRRGELRRGRGPVELKANGLAADATADSASARQQAVLKSAIERKRSYEKNLGIPICSSNAEVWPKAHKESHGGGC